MNKEIDKENRELFLEVSTNFFRLLDPKIDELLSILKKSLNNQDLCKNLDEVYNSYKGHLVDLREYASNDEHNNNFHHFISDLNRNLFKELRNIIAEEYGLTIGDTPPYIFFSSFYIHLNYLKISKKFPKKLDLSDLKIQDFYNKLLDEEKYKIGKFKKIRDFLSEMRENVPDAYLSLLNSLNLLRNVSEHKPKDLEKDFLYSSSKDCGNFYIASNIFMLLSYSLIEILQNWVNNLDLLNSK